MREGDVGGTAPDTPAHVMYPPAGSGGMLKHDLWVASNESAARGRERLEDGQALATKVTKDGQALLLMGGAVCHYLEALRLEIRAASLR